MFGRLWLLPVVANDEDGWMDGWIGCPHGSWVPRDMERILASLFSENGRGELVL